MKTVLLADRFGNNIFTRNSVSTFFEELNSLKEKNVILDFSKIKFISRSCADEYLKQIKTSKKDFLVRNLSPEVEEMIKMVKNSYKDLSFVRKLDSKGAIPA